MRELQQYKASTFAFHATKIMLTTTIIVIAVVAFLIGINGLYVAAEFSAVSARRPRLAQLADEGNSLARYMLTVIENPETLDRYIAACQLGITLSSLVLGYYGQAEILALLQPQIDRLPASLAIVATSASAIVVLVVLTVLQVILGELMPKNVGIQFPEQLAVATAPAMRWSILLFRPLIWFFNGSGQFLLRLIGRTPASEHTHLHSPEEILILVEESSAGGVLDPEERRLLVNTLHLRKLTARKVMIPRTHMLTAPVDKTSDELFALLATSPYSRLPVYEASVDSIVGVLHLKDLIQVVYERAQGRIGVPESTPRQLMHPVVHIPDLAPVEEVMAEMQKHRVNLAIVVNEYGGTAGMITFEDLVEEIFGEFQDEFDIENPPLELRANNRVRVRGDLLLDDLNSTLDLQLPTVEVDTVGGLVVATLGHVPHPGDVVLIGELPLRVDRVVGNSPVAISFPVTPEQAARLREWAAAI
jgi:CBS domain containing-hemolysin-like protein